MSFNPEIYKNKIIDKFKDFQFRRVYMVNCVPQVYANSSKLYITSNSLIYRTSREKTSNDDILLFEFPRYSQFHGFTSTVSLDTDEEMEKLYFSSKTECDINEKGDLVPVSNYRKGYPPKKNHLICGIISTANFDKCRPFLKWFKCSEQFYNILSILRDPSTISGATFDENEKIFESLQTNQLKMVAEQFSEKYTKQCPLDPLQYLWKNEFTESFSKITYFYQFLLRDCIFPKSDIYWKNLQKSSYYNLHSELYLLF